MVLITDISVSDVRFPTSELHWGSDAMHPDPDYSCVYVCIHTDTMMNEKPLCGYGLTFTIGRGNEVVMNAVVALKHCVVGLTLESITSNFAQVWRNLASDTQLRWLGPEKGVIHLATGVIVNTIWDLWARSVSKPLWRLLCDLTPAQLVSTIDFRWITDIITPQEALEMLEKQRPHHASRITHLETNGYPAYTTSAGWLGFTEQQLRELCRQGVKEGWTHFKIKVGNSVEDDINRLEIIRSEIGWERKLMIDANQRWDVGQAIEYVKALAKFKPWFIEEPTSPDDILGHATIRAALAPHGVAVATGEVCANRVIFKQMLQAKALDVLQIDACRIGGVNEILAVLLMANKCGVQVCPHAGGVGLCQYVQHLSIFDHIAVSGRINIIEYVTHLHEHFVTPVQVKNGCYIVPTTPGYSIEMVESSVRDFGYPSGSEWVKRSHKKFQTEAKIDVVTGASPPPGSSYLITGGCGFIGAWIIHRLLEGIHTPRPSSIIILDVKRDLSILEQVLTRNDINIIKFETGDISDHKFVNRVFQEHTITHVIHLAGLQVPTCRANPSAGAMVNVVGTVNVFQAAITFGQKRVQNIVYASSAAVCGPPEDYVGAVKDDGDHKPTTHYGVFKLCNEANARIFWRDNRLPSVGLRPLTVFGVGRELGMTSAPTKAIKAAILGRNYVLPFKGLTSFNDVVDIADLFILTSQRCHEGAHTCNIKGNATTVEQFMSLVEEVLPSARGKFTFDPSAGTIPFPSDFDESSLTSIVGKVPLTPLRDSITRTVQHFQTLASQQRLHVRDL